MLPPWRDNYVSTGEPIDPEVGFIHKHAPYAMTSCGKASRKARCPSAMLPRSALANLSWPSTL
jgi:hypothetical protein